MSLSLREKQSVYHGLGQFLRAGVAPLPALESLLAGTPGRGRERRFLQGLADALRRGDTLPEAFAATRPAAGELERAVVTAAGRGGRLDAACTYLAGYFENLDRLGREFRRGVTWPLCQLHLGVFVLGLPSLFAPGGGPGLYLRQSAGFLLALWVAAALLWLVGAAWGRAAARSSVADGALRGVPLVGGLRRHAALGRFCAAYEIGLSAGINVAETLQGAARASGSALLHRAAHRALPRVRAGEQVGASLAAAGAFPRELLRAVRLGEETGRLDEELRRLAGHHEAAALDRLRALGKWLPKLISLAVAGFLAVQIIRTFQGYVNVLDTLSEGL